MDGLIGILMVIGLFLLRIGLPVITLVVLGILIDRWQSKREKELAEYRQTAPAMESAAAQVNGEPEEVKVTV
ncbi:MAG: hypothetical protein JXQ72_06710 [Anaerolineae bacterium]|nr:hypothetical protein [Anaerolineae bacterium]